MEELIPFDATYVVYKDGDLFSELLALCSLSPIFIVVAFTVLCLFHRYIYIYLYFIGILINVMINLILKQVIAQPRPDSLQQHHQIDYGMPSNHSQFIFFFTTYGILLIHHYIRLLPNHLKYKTYIYTIIDFLLILLALLTSYSRISLGYHSNSQVIFGALIGISLAYLYQKIIYHSTIYSYITNTFNYFNQIIPFLYIKNDQNIPLSYDLFHYEYNLQQLKLKSPPLKSP